MVVTLASQIRSNRLMVLAEHAHLILLSQLIKEDVIHLSSAMIEKLEQVILVSLAAPIRENRLVDQENFVVQIFALLIKRKI